MEKRDEKKVAEIRRLEERIAALREKLSPTSNLRETINAEIASDEKRREMEAKQRAVIEGLDNAIQASHRVATDARNKAVRARLDGNKLVETEYTKLYAISQQKKEEYEIRKVQYEVICAVKDQATVAQMMQEAAIAAQEATGGVSVVDFLIKQKELDREARKQQKEWDTIRNQMGSLTSEMSLTVSSDLLKKAEEQIAAEAAKSTAESLSKSVLAPTKLTGTAALEELERINRGE